MAGNDPAQNALTAFLVFDIQRSPEWARELAERIEDVKAGRLPSWERIGNAYHLTFSLEGATIQDTFDESAPVQWVTLADLEAAVASWRKAMG
jgi:hypothetical protein